MASFLRYKEHTNTYNFMKRFSAICLLGIMVFASCTRTGTSGHHITASSTGSAGSFSSTGSSVNTAGAVGAKITVEGVSASGARLLINLNPYAGITGTFPVDDTIINSCCVYYPVTSSSGIMSAHGFVTLTSVTPDIIGTFNFTARDSAVFTGSFNVPTP